MVQGQGADGAAETQLRDSCIFLDIHSNSAISSMSILLHIKACGSRSGPRIAPFSAAVPSVRGCKFLALSREATEARNTTVDNCECERDLCATGSESQFGDVRMSSSRSTECSVKETLRRLSISLDIMMDIVLRGSCVRDVQSLVIETHGIVNLGIGLKFYFAPYQTMVVRYDPLTTHVP